MPPSIQLRQRAAAEAKACRLVAEQKQLGHEKGIQLQSAKHTVMYCKLKLYHLAQQNHVFESVPRGLFKPP